MDELSYWAKEVAGILEVSHTTLRKWCSALEKYGYEFQKGANKSRVFFERDVLILRNMKELIQTKGATIDTAASLVTSRKEGEESSNVLISKELSVAVPEKIELMQIIERQEQLETLNGELLRRLDEQQRYIDSKIEQRDAQITETMRELLEVKKLVAISLATPKEEKKGFFAQLLNRNK